MKEKIKLTFQILFDNPGRFVLFSKIKRGLRQACGSHFLHDFFHKNVPYLIDKVPYSMDKVSMSQLISFSRYQTKCVIKFLFRQLMTS